MLLFLQTLAGLPKRCNSKNFHIKIIYIKLKFTNALNLIILLKYIKFCTNHAFKKLS